MTSEKNELHTQTLSLLNKARIGDSDAFTALYNLYINRLSGAVHKNMGTHLKNKLETEDLIQSVWKDCFNDMEGFNYQGPDSFYKWLMTRLLNKIRDKYRYFNAKKRDVGKELAIAFSSTTFQGVPEPKASGPTPSIAAMANEDIDRLLSILDRLPDSQRQVLVFRLRDHMEYDEISKRINKTEGAARQLYNRALARVHHILGG